MILWMLQRRDVYCTVYGEEIEFFEPFFVFYKFHFASHNRNNYKNAVILNIEHALSPRPRCWLTKNIFHFYGYCSCARPMLICITRKNIFRYHFDVSKPFCMQRTQDVNLHFLCCKQIGPYAIGYCVRV